MAYIFRENFFERLFQNLIYNFGLIDNFKYKKRIKKLKTKGYFDKCFPEAVNLSLSAGCNAKCIYCPPERGKGISPSFMPFEIAKKVIDEAKLENFKGIFRFGENGEALLNKNFFQIYEYERQNLPFSKSILYTNMSLLNSDAGCKLLTLGLNELNLNIDGASENTYYAAKKLNFEILKKNLHDFIENRNKIDKTCSIQIYVLTARKYMNMIEKISTSLPDDSEQVIEYWKPFLGKNDSISIVDHPYKWALRDKLKLPKKNSCGKISKVVRECLIGSNGEVYLCCFDYQQRCVLGNVRTSSIKEIWTSSKRQTVIKMLEEKQFGAIGEPCRFCLD